MLNFAMIWPGSLAGLAAFQGAFMPCRLLFPSSSFAGTNANFTNSASLLILPALLILWLQLFSHSRGEWCYPQIKVPPGNSRVKSHPTEDKRVTMSDKELKRMAVIEAVEAGRLTSNEGAMLLGLSVRHR